MPRRPIIWQVIGIVLVCAVLEFIGLRIGISHTGKRTPMGTRDALLTTVATFVGLGALVALLVYRSKRRHPERWGPRS